METSHPIRDKLQLNLLRKCLKEVSYRDYCLFEVGLNGAYRVTDLLQLRIKDVSEGVGVIKSRYPNGMPISSEAHYALTRYLSEREKYLPDDPLFVSRKRKNGQLAPIQRDIVYKTLRRAAIKAGINLPIGCHTMRKSWGYHEVLSGRKLSSVKKILNHPSIKSTLSYIGFTAEEIREILSQHSRP
ncbi:tyrosine-type recombinase/integrase [Bacillus sp. FSL K6-6540]|uniref:tyrosine-type recombinase/integrase n=1 Tax=Bacillus sp. FSL K6-6540 TaxID=2921512 RepID=UPI0030F76056